MNGAPRELRCWAEIDLAALERNVAAIRASLPRPMRYLAVVKADAYGLGVHHVAARLMHAGADMFAVANVTEARALRELGGGWPVLVLSPLLPAEDEALADGDIAATVSSAEEVERFVAVAHRAKRIIPVHLKIDTGMGRAGVWHEDAPAVCERLLARPELRLEGVCTHFASPDDDAAFTAEQRARFLTVLGRCAGLRVDGLIIHADNSAGLATLPEASPFNAVRVGLLQFGVRPRHSSLVTVVNIEPVFSFHTRVALVKRLPRGASIGYGRTHVLARDSRIAVLCAGYGDGIPRAASNRAVVLVRGQRCAVLGRVSMDQTVVDVTGVESIVPGDEAVLVGRQAASEITLTEFSEHAGTVPWETLTSVTKRVPRLYKTALGV